MNFRKTFAAVLAASTLLAGYAAEASPYVMVAWHQRSTSGAMSSLAFKSGTAQGCPAAAPFKQPCYNPANAWVTTQPTLISDVQNNPPTFDWNGTTLAQTGGILWATSFLSSNMNGTAVISDRITGLTITPGTSTTTAATYQCFEGNFLAGVGASGCLNVNLGNDGVSGDGVTPSSAVYNVGGNANCVQRTIVGDDFSTGDVRTAFETVGGGGCDAGDGAFNQWLVIPNGRFLILANIAPITNDGCYTFGRAEEKSSSPCAADIPLSGVSYLIFAPAVDTDSDTIVDALDNCRTLSNATQVDSNGDGYGNRCDGDLNNNGSTNAQDTTLYRQQLGQPSTAPTYNQADLNANGSVNAQDTTLFRGLLGSPPGQSGICLNTYPCAANP